MTVWKEVKEEFFERFGNACKCCGESRKEFLTIEHKNGDGSEQRKNGRSTFSILLELRRIGWPSDSELEINCYNCNCAKGKSKGICPHDIEKGLSPALYSSSWTYRPKLKYGEIVDVVKNLLVCPSTTQELLKKITEKYDRKKVYGNLTSTLRRLTIQKIIRKVDGKWIII